MGASATILGIAQDGGIPQPALSLDNWDAFLSGQVYHPVSLGVKTSEGDGHLFDVTRSLSWQLALWQNSCNGSLRAISDIWISHSHLGHIDGLLQFGKASMGLKGVKLRCSELFANEIKSNMWLNQLVNDGTFVLHIWRDGSDINIEDGYSVQPISIPHRNEGSDTHCFLISGVNKKLLYLTDHDSWDQTLGHVGYENPMEWFNALDADIVLIDGTFWSNRELTHRSQDEVPHPPIEQTLELLGTRNEGDPQVIFIHINHTNPILNSTGIEYLKLNSLGWCVGKEGHVFELS